MAQGELQKQAVQTALDILPGLIQGTEDYLGAGNGADKHAIVLQAATTVVAGAVSAVATNNPKWAPWLSMLINLFVNSRKKAGNPVTPGGIATPISGTAT